MFAARRGGREPKVCISVSGIFGCGRQRPALSVREYLWTSMGYGPAAALQVHASPRRRSLSPGACAAAPGLQTSRFRLSGLGVRAAGGQCCTSASELRPWCQQHGRLPHGEAMQHGPKQCAARGACVVQPWQVRRLRCDRRHVVARCQASHAHRTERPKLWKLRRDCLAAQRVRRDGWRSHLGALSQTPWGWRRWRPFETHTARNLSLPIGEASHLPCLHHASAWGVGGWPLGGLCRGPSASDLDLCVAVSRCAVEVPARSRRKARRFRLRPKRSLGSSDPWAEFGAWHRPRRLRLNFARHGESCCARSEPETSRWSCVCGLCCSVSSRWFFFLSLFCLCLSLSVSFFVRGHASASHWHRTSIAHV